MEEYSEQKRSNNQIKTEQKDSTSQNKNLQESRASILENHLNKNKSANTSPKEIEIKKLKEEINKIKNGVAESPVIEPSNEEYAQLVEKTLFQFRNEINSPINSIEYSTESLKLEYERIINYFKELSDSAYPAEALARALDYVNQMVNVTDDAINAAELRERKKTFIELLKEYEFKNSNKAADYFVSSGVFYIDDELYWIFSQPKAEILFDLMISVLSIRQSFEILNSAKSRTRELTANLIIQSTKSFQAESAKVISEEEKAGDKILKRKFIYDEIIPVVKMVIILLNLYAIAKVLFHI